MHTHATLLEYYESMILFFSIGAQPGRPRIIISREQLICLREMGFTWIKIVDMIGVSRRTIYSRRIELGIDDPCSYSSISDSM